MAEPVVSVATTTVSVSALTLFGANLGLQPGLLVAGAFGAFAGIMLLNTVPSDTTMAWWKALIVRMMVMLASAGVSAYLTPMVLILMALPEPALFSCAFVIGGSAQLVMQKITKRVTTTVEGATP